jgi:hypothetical protein
MDIATWIIVAVLSWAAYAGYSNLKTSKKFVDDLYSEPKENIPLDISISNQEYDRKLSLPERLYEGGRGIRRFPV